MEKGASSAAQRAFEAMEQNGPEPLSPDELSLLFEKASKVIEQNMSNDTDFRHQSEKLYPRFESNELELGKLLGTGGFCQVFEVKSIKLTSQAANALEEDHLKQVKDSKTRYFMSNYYLRDGQARYALKKLSRESLSDQDKYYRGVIDIAVEARFLCSLEHPHIIKLRGMAFDGYLKKDFFLIMDKLYETLEVKMRKWNEMNESYTGCCGMFTGGDQKAKDLLGERILYAWDIANAIKYIHEKKIIYRDLKSENLGFDVRDDIKIFDFGLAKDVSKLDLDDDGTYKLTGYTGSIIYMAPEVMTYKPYNFKADVYSFGILFWELISLKVPYTKYNVNLITKLVGQKGMRPAIDPKWSDELGRTMKLCWSDDINARPSFDELTKIISALTNEDAEDSQLLDISMRSLSNLRK